MLYDITPSIKKKLKFNLNRLIPPPGEVKTIFIISTNNTVSVVHYAQTEKISLFPSISIGRIYSQVSDYSNVCSGEQLSSTLK